MKCALGTELLTGHDLPTSVTINYHWTTGVPERQRHRGIAAHVAVNMWESHISYLYRFPAKEISKTGLCAVVFLSRYFEINDFSNWSPVRRRHFQNNFFGETCCVFQRVQLAISYHWFGWLSTEQAPSNYLKQRCSSLVTHIYIIRSQWVNDSMTPLQHL